MKPSIARGFEICSSMALLLVLAVAQMTHGAEEFYLRDGDRVVFYGDSITEQAHYTLPIEKFVVTRFPDWNISFANSGWGGERAWGGEGGMLAERLQRDVVRHNPTVVTVMLGMNDGYYTNFDEKSLDVFRKSIEELIATLEQQLPRVRITLIGTSPYDNITPGEQPEWEQIIDGGYDSVVARYSRAMHEIAQKHDLIFVDMHQPLVKLLKQLQADNPQLARQLIPDRIHPGKAAGLVMAAELLRAWHAPLPPSIEVEGMLLGNWPITRSFESPAAYSIESDPLTSYLFQKGNWLAFFSPPRLQIINLPLERVSLWLDDSDMGTFTQTELEKGIELPQNGDHSAVLAKLIDVRAKLRFKKWREGELASTKNADDLAKTEVEMIVNEMELEVHRSNLIKATQHAIEIRKPLSE